MQGRSKKGTFLNKSNSDRQVKSIRATEKIWNKFGEEAERLSITRADLLEKMFSDDGVIHGNTKPNNDGVIHGKMLEILGILRHGITPKKHGGTYASNNAKSLKEEVLKVIAILEKLTE